jgi:MoaA/NifB/PqqE/SkfB family radical SAM enzyme
MSNTSLARIFLRMRTMWSQRADEILRGTIRPTMIANLAVTSMCNLRCASCNIGRNYLANPQLAQDDLTLEELDAILARDLDTLKHVSWIQITGGEPFLRPDIIDILVSLRSRLPNCSFWIPTNGSHPESITARVREILATGVRLGIGVSLHGTPERHDAFSGRQGSYGRAVETVDRLKAMQADGRRLRISISYTVTPKNVKDLGYGYELARERGVEFTCRVALPSDLYYQVGDLGTSGKGFTAALEREIADLERKMGFQRPLVSPLRYPRWRYYRGLVRHVRDPHRRQLRCRAGKTSLYISSRGEVHPCIFIPEKMGNLREKPLGEILHTRENRSLMERIERGECPNCWVESETYRVIAENSLAVLRFGMAGTARNWLRLLAGSEGVSNPDPPDSR